MAAEPRYVPPGGALVEVSNRTLQGRFLLQPSADMNGIVIGVVGRAQRLFDMTICAFQFLSDHYHMLLCARDARQLAGFMEYFDGNLAREAGRLSNWRGKFWHSRYFSAVVKDHEESQLDRLNYLLANGCKEGLVASPLEWPGASSTAALLDGSMSVSGTWYDRTKQYRARLKGREELFPIEESVFLARLPYAVSMTQGEYERIVRNVIAKIEAETAAKHRASRTRPAGAEWVKAQHPHRVPREIKRSRAKRFLAAFRESVVELREAYADFLERYRAASLRLRQGDRLAEFPTGSFPPHLPFVRAGP